MDCSSRLRALLILKLDTSNFPAEADKHGRHGVFLASVASLSLLSITSHHKNFHSHNSMSIHNSTVLTRNTPSLPEQRLLTFTHGTRVTVRDLFGSMPVRVKHRALQAEKSSFTRDWERLALDTVALLIPWPAAISITIRDSGSRQILNFKKSSEPQKWVNDSCRLLYQASLCDTPSVSDWVPIGASSPTLSFSGFVSCRPVATKRIQFISLGIAPLSNEFRCNILYEEVNKVFADSSFGLVENENDDFETSTSDKASDFTKRDLKARKGVDRWPMFFLKLSPISSSLDVHDIFDDRQPSLAIITDLLKAMFFEFLKRHHCRPRQVALSAKSKSVSQQQYGKSYRSNDFAFASSRNKEKVASSDRHLTTSSTQEFSRLEAVDGPSDSPLAISFRIKSGRTLHTFEESAPSRSRTQSRSSTPNQTSQTSTPGRSTDGSRASTPAEASRPSLFDANGKLTRKPFDDIDPQEVLSVNSGLKFGTTLQTHRPNAHFTSGPVPRDDSSEYVDSAAQMETAVNPHPDSIVAPKILTTTQRQSEPKTEEASRVPEECIGGIRAKMPWVFDLIGKWKNPVFELTDPPIPKLPDVMESLGLDARPLGQHYHHGQAMFTTGTRHEAAAMGLQGRLSKTALQEAHLIAQVDKKFIFAKLPFDHIKGGTAESSASSEPSYVLALIDQHAADERCRVEELMADYFEPSTDDDGVPVWKAVTMALAKPIQFELSGQDRYVLREFQSYFAYWGICYDVEAAVMGSKNTKSSRDTRAKVVVRSLPPAILERCRTDTRLLADLIRREAWKLKDEDRLVRPLAPIPVSPVDMDSGIPAWVSLFHACPSGIVDLINSRSCRSRFYTALLPL